jgi:glycosyltransferase involved in cell wall biosynthesis
MKKLWYRKYYSFNDALENSDHVDFLSPYILEGVRKRNIVIEDNRYSITDCSAADYSKCMVGNKTAFEVAFCARLEPDKNPILYLQAAKEVLKEFPGIKFHILGEGSLVNEVNEFINSNNLHEKINFQFHKNPPEIFANTSIFVTLQTGTNYPSLSTIEAMACGNAVIASDVGDTGLLINESNGVLVKLDPDSVAAAMKNLIRNKEKRETLGLNGREFVLRNHTIEKESEYYINIAVKIKEKVFGGTN